MQPLLQTGLLCGFQPPAFDEPSVPIEVRDALPPGTPLLERDPGDHPHVYSTEHFVLKWGDDLVLPEGFEIWVLEDLEMSWSHQVDVLGWQRPHGTETHKIDVFIGNSHPDSPTISFDGAYVTASTLSREPYIVVSQAIVEARRSQAAQTLSHEFNHTLQIGPDDRYDGDRGLFWFEATANWAAAETTGVDAEFESWGPFLLHPEYALYTFVDISDFSEPVRTGRQYTAAMFVQHLADAYGPDLIRRSWDEAEPAGSPMPWLSGEVEGDISAEYAAFAATVGTGDTPYANFYSRGAQGQAFSLGRDGVTAWIPPEGGSGSPEDDLAPEGFAWNRLAWFAEQPSSITFTLTPDAQGSSGNNSHFVNTAVVESEGIFTSHAFTDSVTLAVEEGDFVHFVLTSLPDRHDDRETFSYTYDLAVEVDKGKKCGCAQTETRWWMVRR